MSLGGSRESGAGARTGRGSQGTPKSVHRRTRSRTSVSRFVLWFCNESLGIKSLDFLFIANCSASREQIREMLISTGLLLSRCCFRFFSSLWDFCVHLSHRKDLRARTEHAQLVFRATLARGTWFVHSPPLTRSPDICLCVIDVCVMTNACVMSCSFFAQRVRLAQMNRKSMRWYPTLNQSPPINRFRGIHRNFLTMSLCDMKRRLTTAVSHQCAVSLWANCLVCSKCSRSCSCVTCRILAKSSCATLTTSKLTQLSMSMVCGTQGVNGVSIR